MTTTTTSTTPLQKAVETRSRELDELAVLRTREMERINGYFVAVLRNQIASGRTVAEIAPELGLSRQVIYSLLSRYPASVA